MVCWWKQIKCACFIHYFYSEVVLNSFVVEESKFSVSFSWFHETVQTKAQKRAIIAYLVLELYRPMILQRALFIYTHTQEKIELLLTSEKCPKLIFEETRGIQSAI